jgi:hypothetical protein
MKDMLAFLVARDVMDHNQVARMGGIRMAKSHPNPTNFPRSEELPKRELRVGMAVALPDDLRVEESAIG